MKEYLVKITYKDKSIELIKADGECGITAIGYMINDIENKREVLVHPASVIKIERYDIRRTSGR